MKYEVRLSKRADKELASLEQSTMFSASVSWRDLERFASHTGLPVVVKGIVTRDRWDVAKADVVLMNLVGATQVSIGTMVELGWAER